MDRNKGAVSVKAASPEFAKGNVCRIEVRNFMTYDHCIVTPGPKLNLILGPNGSGKSSLVCAICVGLAGSTKLLGRADKVGEFVKRGCESGSVQINLFSGEHGRDLVVYRKIRSDNTSEWKLNGTSASQKKVEEMISKYDVQLDNLTQFLPQDKVSSFARMDGVELLHATEQSLTDRSLHERHMRLIEKRDSIRGLEVSVANYEQELGQLREMNAGLERDVERFQQREKLKVQAAEMKKKIPWVLFWDFEKEIASDKLRFDQYKEKLVEKRKEIQRLEDPLKAIKNSVAKMKRMYEALQGDAKKAQFEYQKKEALIEGELFTEISDMADNFATADKKIKDAQKKVDGLKVDVQQLKSQLESLPEVPTESPEIAKLKREIHELEKQHRALLNQHHVAKEAMRVPQQQLALLEQKLQRLGDVKLQRLRNASRVTGSDLVAARQFVESVRSQLRGPVYGPLACEVHVKHAEHAPFLEQHVPRWCWNMFVVTSQADHSMLCPQLKRFGVNISTYQGDPGAPIDHPNGEGHTYASYGITYTLDEVFDAPNIVKHILKDNSQIHRAYVGSNVTDQKMDAFRNDPRCSSIERVYTPSSMYSKIGSRYSNNVSWSVNNVRPARMIVDGGDAAGKDVLEAQIREVRDELVGLANKADALEKQRKPFEKRIDEALDEKEEIDRARKELKKQHNQLKSKVHAKMVRLEQAKKGLIDPSVKDNYRKKLEKASEKVADVIKQASGHLEKLASLRRQEIENGLSHEELSHQFKRLSTHITVHKSEQQKLEENLAKLREMMKNSEANLKMRKEVAIKETGPLTPELEAKFAEMPATVVELEEEYAELLDKANNVMCQNENVMVEYESRCKKIAELEKTFGLESSVLERDQAAIQADKELWLPSLKNLICDINESFTEKFSQVGCAGEVRLMEAEDEFDKYEIVIMVKFRESEDLAPLGTTRQSGGERSVSTVMYLLSLQALTVCPFRVVDEINQGMDPTNERRMFQQMVEAATRPGTPQCFILTPKLLPDLKYSKDVTILFIFCGPWLDDVSKLWNGPARKRLRACASVV